MPDIKIYHPNKGLGLIPDSELETAKTEGATVVTDNDAVLLGSKRYGYDPDGTLGVVDKTELDQAIKDGFTLAPYDVALKSAREQFQKAVNTDNEKKAAYDISHGSGSKDKKQLYTTPALTDDFTKQVQADADAKADYDSKQRTLKGQADGATYEPVNDPLYVAPTKPVWDLNKRVGEAVRAHDAQNRALDTEAANSPVLAATQGALRAVGGDFIRHYLNEGESKLQKALGYTPDQFDIFADDTDVLRIKDQNPILATGGEVVGGVASSFVPVSKLGGVISKVPAGAKALTAGAKILAKTPTIAKTAAVGAASNALSTVQDAFLRKDYNDIGEKAAVSGLIGAATGGLIEGAAILYNKKLAHESAVKFAEKINKNMEDHLTSVVPGAKHAYKPRLPAISDDLNIDPIKTPVDEMHSAFGVSNDLHPQAYNRDTGEIIIPPAKPESDTLLNIPKPSPVKGIEDDYNRDWGLDNDPSTNIGLDDTAPLSPPKDTYPNKNKMPMSPEEEAKYNAFVERQNLLDKQKQKPTNSYIEDAGEESPISTTLIEHLENAGVRKPAHTMARAGAKKPELIPGSRIETLDKLAEFPELTYAIKQDLHREIRDRANDVERLAAAIENKAGVAAKSGHLIKDFIEPYPGTARTASEAVMHTRRQYGLAADALDEIAKNGGSAGKGGRSAISVLKEKLNGIEDTHFVNSDVPLKGVVYSVLDQQKRALGEAIANTKNVYVKHKLAATYEQLRGHLEDSRVWGDKLAVEQRKVNEAWAEYIGHAQHDAIRKLKQQGAETNPADLFQKLPVVNDSFLSSLINNIGTAEHETTEAAVFSYYKSKAADARMRAEIWGSAQARADAHEIALKTNELLHGLATSKNLNKQLSNGTSATAGKTGSMTDNMLSQAGAAGALMGGLGEAASLGKAATYGGYGIAAGLGVKGLKWAGKKTIGYFSKKADIKYAEKIRSVFPTIERALQAEETLQKLEKQKLYDLMGFHNVDRKQLVYDKLKQKTDKQTIPATRALTPATQIWLDKLYNDEDQDTDNTHTPELQDPVSAIKNTQREYLSAKLDDPSLTTEQKTRIVSTIHTPLDTLRDLHSGNIYPEQMQAIQAVYPGVHTRIINSVLPQIEALPYNHSLVWKRKLGLPAMDPTKLASIQTNINPANAGILTPGNTRAPKMRV